MAREFRTLTYLAYESTPSAGRSLGEFQAINMEDAWEKARQLFDSTALHVVLASEEKYLEFRPSIPNPEGRGFIHYPTVLTRHKDIAQTHFQVAKQYGIPLDKLLYVLNVMPEDQYEMGLEVD